MKKELEGMTVTLPSATRNMFVDGALFTPFSVSARQAIALLVAFFLPGTKPTKH